MKKYFIVLGLLVICGACAARAVAQGPDYVGFVDRVDCNRMAGWAADRNRPNVPINVSIYVDGNSSPLMTVLANIQREPAVGQNVGSTDNGQHGFDFGAPLRDGQSHTFTFKFESSSTLVRNGSAPNPASLTCGLFNAGTQTILTVDFKINNGAASTKGRLASLTFSANLVTGSTSQDATSQITAYRARESPDLRDADLTGQLWSPFTHGLILELAEHNGAGQRYGDRKIMFQVKTNGLTSGVVSDTITLEPVLKEYRVSASGGVHPLIQYAASQGFTFPLSFYETCNGDCSGGFGADPGLATGTAKVLTQVTTTSAGGGSPGGANPNLVTCVAVGAVIGGVAASVPGAVIGAAIGGVACGGSNPAPGVSGSCTTKADYILFDGRGPNQFWTIKSVSVSDSEVFVRFHGANKFLVKFIHEPKDATCTGGKNISIGEVVVEGPEVDDFVDAANPWKNAFVRPTLRLIQPGVVPRPN